ncbi:MAG: putative bifunctional diguanylate cyclase/phosphodiesterase [Pseudomonadales bacterium]
MFDRLSILLLDLMDIAQGDDAVEALNSEHCSSYISASTHDVHDRAVELRPDLIVITAPEIDDALLNLSASLEYANPDGRIHTVLIAASDDIDLEKLKESNVACVHQPPENWSIFAQQMQLMAITGRKANLLESAFLESNSALRALNAASCIIDIASESCQPNRAFFRLLGLDFQRHSQLSDTEIHWRALIDGIDSKDHERLVNEINAAIKHGTPFSSNVALAQDSNIQLRCFGTVHKGVDGGPLTLQLSCQRETRTTPLPMNFPSAPQWKSNYEFSELNERLQSRASGTVLLIRLESFAEICKTLGYIVGQQLLTEIRARVLGELRQNDTVIQDKSDTKQNITRIGGGEFIAVLGEVVEPHHVTRVKRRIFDSLKQPLTIEGKQVPIEVALGSAVWPQEGLDANELLLSASLSADCAHITNSNDASSAPVEIGRARNAIRLEADLYDAVLNEELVLVYQPKYSLSNGKIIGVEALLRWHNNHDTWVQPDVFIPIAERNGLIVPIGQWVIQEALRCHARWYDQGLGRVSIAINISPQQMRDDSIIEFMVQSCKQYGIPTKHIELEVTENCLIENTDLVTRILEGLSKAGFVIALDDFGTGFSSLSYLHSLPLDVLKIDRTFVSSLTENSYNPGLIAGIVGIGLTLGLRIVAEGIENELQWELLNDWGCHCGQGFLMSRPIFEDEASALLRDRYWSGAAQIHGVGG